MLDAPSRRRVRVEPGGDAEVVSSWARIQPGSWRGLVSSIDGSIGSRPGTLVVGERTRYCDDSLLESPPRRDRVGLWRDQKAFEIHCALRRVSMAGHAIDVQLAVLLRLMVDQSGYRRWGHDSFGDYVTQELRQRSARRFRYLVAIDRAIVARPLPQLG